MRNDWKELIGKRVRWNGDSYKLLGILDDGDDLYYALSNLWDRQLCLLSCVGSLEEHGVMEAPSDE